MLGKLQNNRLMLGIAAAVVLVLLVGGYMLFGPKSATNDQVDEDEFVDENIPRLSPEEVGLELVLSSNKRQVKFILNKAEGFSSAEYEISYEADDPQNKGNRITRGVAGEEQISGGDVFESKFFDLGSCSSGTCRYDTGVEKVDLLLKLTKTDGKVFQVQDSVEL